MAGLRCRPGTARRVAPRSSRRARAVGHRPRGRHRTRHLRTLGLAEGRSGTRYGSRLLLGVRPLRPASATDAHVIGAEYIIELPYGLGACPRAKRRAQVAYLLFDAPRGVD